MEKEIIPPATLSESIESAKENLRKFRDSEKKKIKASLNHRRN